jgi:hypothetical protein
MTQVALLFIAVAVLAVVLYVVFAVGERKQSRPVKV